MAARTIRLVGIAGILQFFLAYVPVALVPPSPSFSSTAGAVAHYYESNRDALLLVNWLGALGLVASFFFTAGLIATMRRAEGPGGWLWLAFTVAVVVAYATLTVSFVVGALLPYEAASTPQETLKLLSDLESFAFSFYSVSLVGAYIALARLVWTTQFLPRWLGGLAALVVIGAVAGCVGLLVQSGPYAGGWVSLGAIVLEGIFVLAASIFFVARPRLMALAEHSADS